MNRTPLALDVEQLIGLISDLLESRTPIEYDACPVCPSNHVLSNETECLATTS
jgi:hypothetical protein